MGLRYKQFSAGFFQLLVARLQVGDDNIHYTDIPLEMIAPCAIADVHNTDKIMDHMEKEIKEFGLERAAEIYNSQAKLGFEMETGSLVRLAVRSPNTNEDA
jgi:hypothetical protein